MIEQQIFYWTGVVIVISLMIAICVLIVTIVLTGIWYGVTQKSYRMFRDWKLSRDFCYDNQKLFNEWYENKYRVNK